MQIFTTNVEIFTGRDINLKQEGEVSIGTRIELRGNHKKGPIPVSVWYDLRFTPNEEYWQTDPDYSEKNPYPTSYTKRFETPEERETWIKNRFDRHVRSA